MSKRKATFRKRGKYLKSDGVLKNGDTSRTQWKVLLSDHRYLGRNGQKWWWGHHFLFCCCWLHFGFLFLLFCLVLFFNGLLFSKLWVMNHLVDHHQHLFWMKQNRKYQGSLHILENCFINFCCYYFNRVCVCVLDSFW